MSFEYPFHDRHGFPLPRATTDADARVEVSPGLNALAVPPTVHDALAGAIGVLQFPVAFAGYRSRTAAAVAFHAHKRELARAMRAMVDGDDALGAGARRVRGHDRALTDLQAEFGDVTCAGLHAFLSWLVEDEAYVDWYASTYAENASLTDEAAVRAAVATLGRGAGRGGHLSSLAADYREVLDRHGLGAFETAMDVALDPPLATDAPAELAAESRTGRGRHASGPDAPRVLATRDLRERAERVLDAVVDQAGTAGADLPLATLHGDVRDAIGDPPDGGLAPAAATDDWTSQPAVAALPLLADPHRARPVDRAARQHQDSVGYPSGAAWLMAQTFEAGGFGAVLYRRPDGDPNWLVNPYVASDPVHDDETAYAAVWERAFVTDRLTARLLDRADDAPRGDRALECPLCALSTDTCGDDACAYADRLATVRERAPDVVDALASVQA